MLISLVTKDNSHSTTHIKCDRILVRAGVIEFVTPLSIYSFGLDELLELVIEKEN